MSERQFRLEIVYQSRHQLYGSVELRVIQLAEMLECYLGDRVSVRLVPFDKVQWYLQEGWAFTRPGNTAILFSKSCLKNVRQSTLGICRLRGLVTLIDYVDGDLGMARHLSPDLHLAASYGAERELNLVLNEKPNRGREAVRLLHHNTDTRLESAMTRDLESLRPVYIGDPRNTFRSPDLANAVSFVPFKRSTEVEEVREAIANSNFHICVRNPVMRDEGNVLKPFTKGFLAAHVGAPVLAWRHDPEAMRFLGDDYPYLIETLDETSVLNGIAYADETYKTKVWEAAVDRMRSIRREVNNQKIAVDLFEIISAAMNAR
ncbi:hypothetical protein [Roseivivax sediminis]|uniref:Glycosyl transferases group 1 n=1 Tax=Roseivivax sediminis TaxID=936889 RepID=A0A1I1XIR4_9RHOB|nr:hypothetical protein [Roseivivax sediminis]SFE07245.1 hypothetical protein SAMN04515678_10610 [Roseivivax sediminis]